LHRFTNKSIQGAAEFYPNLDTRVRSAGTSRAREDFIAKESGAEKPGLAAESMGFDKWTPIIAPALRYLSVMPIDDLQQAAQKIAGFLNNLNKLGGLRLKYRISAADGASEGEGAAARQISVELAGPDVPLVIQHNGELLRALETLAAQMLRLDHHEHDMVSFDAANFKALRAEELRLAAEAAAEKVRQTGLPYSFPPMNSRERRMLHLACRALQGVETASVGEGSNRFLVVYPEGKTNLPVTPQFKPRGFGRR
jgi:spoIIIJ-associated protein